MKVVRLSDVRMILKKYAGLKGTKKLKVKKPNHPKCCMCQSCGYTYKNCVCNNNELIDILTQVTIEVNNGR